MKKRQTVFHALCNGIVFLAFLFFVFQFLLEWIVRNDLPILDYAMEVFHCLSLMVFPVLCFLYGALALWFRPTKRPMLRLIRSVLPVLAVAWILIDFGATIGFQNLWNPFHGVYARDIAKGTYWIVVLFCGFLHLCELYFPYPRKGKRADILVCIFPILFAVAGLGGGIWLLCCDIEGLLLSGYLLSLPISVYVLYSGIAKLARQDRPFRRQLLVLFSMIFAMKNLFSPLLLYFCLVGGGFAIALFFVESVGSFFAYWALGIWQRSLESTWPKQAQEEPVCGKIPEADA